MDKTNENSAVTFLKNAGSKVIDVSIGMANGVKKLADAGINAVKAEFKEAELKKQARRKKELDDYSKIIEAARAKIKENHVRAFVDSLGISPTELVLTKAKSLKEAFPIPREQTIIWASIKEKTNRVGGILVTDKGVFAKTFVSTFEENAIDKEKRKASRLFYYPWDSFNPEDFLNSNTLSLLFSFTEGDMKEFIQACKKNKDKVETKADFYSYGSQIIAGESIAVGAFLDKGNIKFARNNGFGNNQNAGHGLFAERANTMADIAHFKNAKVVGGKNVKNGPDRLVSGVEVQTKYYKTVVRSVGAAFDKDTGLYRYFNKDNTPMKLEVPKDQYDSALNAFKTKISEGKVPGVNDPSEAESIVVKGSYTYQQTRQMAKAGTIDSLSYDVKTGAVTATCVFGISFLIDTFLCYRETHDLKEAMIDGLKIGLKNGSLAMASHILASQLSRTSLFAQITSKGLINSGVVGAASSFAVLSIHETYEYFKNKISSAQYATNMVILSASTAGGTTGALIGSAIGIGSKVACGIGGGLVGGAIGGLVASKTMGMIFESDGARFRRLFDAVMMAMGSEYLLDKEEMDELVSELGHVRSAEFSRLVESVHASKHQEARIRYFLAPFFDKIVGKRKKLSVNLALLVA